MPNEPSDTIIRVENMTARYGEELILEKINFNVDRGEILGILGPSGCGKSTLLRHMVGLNRPHQGRVLIDGKDITGGEDTVFRAALKKIGILFQGGALIGSMTLAENIALPIIEHTDLSNQSINKLVSMKMEMVGLAGFEGYLPSEISGGMKKRAGFARALALNPKILFLDEPTAGLDPIMSAEINRLIRHINRALQTTMIIVTHELDIVFGTARRIIMLDKKDKGIIADGNPSFLRKSSSRPEVLAFFNQQGKNK